MTLQEKIAVMQHYEKTQDPSQIEVEINSYWETMTGEPLWDWSKFSYRIKPKPTREEITAQWVKDNGLKVGDKVKVVRKSSIAYIWDEDKDKLLDKVGLVDCIMDNSINVEFDMWTGKWAVDIESLEKVKEEYVPYTFEDREELRGKWFRNKKSGQEFMVTEIGRCSINNRTYKYLLKDWEYLDGRPFGKIKE